MAIILGEGGPRDRARLELATRKSNPIPNFQKPDRHPDSLKAAEKVWTKRFPNIRPRSLDATYNCVGLVFAFRRTWIEDEHLAWLLGEDGYVKALRPETGDLVVYSDGDGRMNHVGIVVVAWADVSNANWEATVLSQWGQDGEYIHHVSDVPPVFGKHVTYYTERKTHGDRAT